MLFQTLQNALHTISSTLLYPVIILLIAFAAFAIFEIGSLVVEAIVERRHFRVNMPQFLNALDAASIENADETIKSSALLMRQKELLLTMFDNRTLEDEARYALARKLITDETAHYQNRVGITDMVSRLAPMFGLMGTLIPLGPGIIALGNGDTATLSTSIGIAFDTTVTGLIVAAVCLIVSRFRKNWYDSYMLSLETAMTSLLEKIDDSVAEAVEASKGINERGAA